jgi:diguanylate cyclase (GGDEF)-like protein
MSIGLVADEAALALERADLIAQLRDLSLRDPLTGLHNRRAWDMELDRELSRAARHRYPLCVAVLDLDRFKAYNDEMGHQGGDWLLRSASAAWAAVLRDTDVLARWGGEEFAICLPNCSPAEAQNVVARLRALVPDSQTCSAGLAAWDGTEGPAELLARADRALYQAKDAGRDRLVMATA